MISQPKPHWNHLWNANQTSNEPISCLRALGLESCHQSNQCLGDQICRAFGVLSVLSNRLLSWAWGHIVFLRHAILQGFLQSWEAKMKIMESHGKKRLPKNFQSCHKLSWAHAWWNAVHRNAHNLFYILLYSIHLFHLDATQIIKTTGTC